MAASQRALHRFIHPMQESIENDTNDELVVHPFNHDNRCQAAKPVSMATTPRVRRIHPQQEQSHATDTYFLIGGITFHGTIQLPGHTFSGREQDTSSLDSNPFQLNQCHYCGCARLYEIVKTNPTMRRLSRWIIAVEEERHSKVTEVIYEPAIGTDIN